MSSTSAWRLLRLLHLLGLVVEDEALAAGAPRAGVSSAHARGNDACLVSCNAGICQQASRATKVGTACLQWVTLPAAWICFERCVARGREAVLKKAKPAAARAARRRRRPRLRPGVQGSEIRSGTSARLKPPRQRRRARVARSHKGTTSVTGSRRAGQRELLAAADRNLLPTDQAVLGDRRVRAHMPRGTSALHVGAHADLPRPLGKRFVYDKIPTPRENAPSAGRLLQRASRSFTSSSPRTVEPSPRIDAAAAKDDEFQPSHAIWEQRGPPEFWARTRARRSPQLRARGRRQLTRALDAKGMLASTLVWL